LVPREFAVDEETTTRVIQVSRNYHGRTLIESAREPLLNACRALVALVREARASIAAVLMVDRNKAHRVG
jgi:hypothetical protein